MNRTRHDFRSPDYANRKGKKLLAYYDELDCIISILNALTPEQKRAVDRLVGDKYDEGYNEGYDSGQTNYTGNE